MPINSIQIWSIYRGLMCYFIFFKNWTLPSRFISWGWHTVFNGCSLLWNSLYFLYNKSNFSWNVNISIN